MSGGISSATSDQSGTGHLVLGYVREAALMRLPGAAPEFLDVEMRFVVAEFLSRTLVWRRRIDVPMTYDQGIYRLAIQDYEGVAAIIYAEMSDDSAGVEGNTALRLGLTTQISRSGSHWGFQRAGMLDHARISFQPVPTVNRWARVDVALTLLPHVEAPVPDVVLPWQDVLLSGLLARMMGMQDKPYTNYALANFHQREFLSRMSQIRREQDGGRAYGSDRVRMRRFGV